MNKISLKEARSLALHSQLINARPVLRGKEGVRQVFEQISYVQIDTLSVVKRAHHHVLWSRIPDYREAYLKELQKERVIFEYWAHAASYLPMRDYRFTLPRQKQVRAGKGMWHYRNPKLTQYALDRIKAEGPLTSRDFKKGDTRLYFGDKKEWSTSPISHTLFQLFMEGRLMIVRRKGFQKVYDLTERVLPESADTRSPSKEEYIRRLIHRDVQAHGLVKLTEIGYLLKNTNSDIRLRLKEMTEAGEIIELQVEGQAQTYFTRPDILENLPPVSRERRIRILSPFDNTVIQRRRLEELFGFSYTLECYVPKAKRKVGYFSLPLLRGTEFVGQIDVKADRKNKILQIKNLVWEAAYDKNISIRQALDKSLQEFARFNECETVE